MKEDFNLPELKRLNERLTKLLADPQPGFVTWLSMLENVTEEIGEWCPKPLKDPPHYTTK